jgi:hypothetical protein
VNASKEEWNMTTAIIGVGNIGSAVAGHLAAGDELVVLAAKDQSDAEAVAQGPAARASAASVEDAIAAGDAIVFALWLDALQDVVRGRPGAASAPLSSA